MLQSLVLVVLGTLAGGAQAVGVYTGKASINEPQPYARAVERIFEQALQENELLLVSEISGQNQELIHSKLDSYSFGYVEQYEVLSVVEEGQEVLVTARVEVKNVGQDLLGFFRSAEFSRIFGRPQIYLNVQAMVADGDATSLEQRTWLQNYLSGQLSSYQLDLREDVDGAIPQTAIAVDVHLTGGRGADETFTAMAV